VVHQISTQFKSFPQNILFEYDDGYKASPEELVESLSLLRMDMMRKRDSGYYSPDSPVKSDTVAVVRDAGRPNKIHLHAPFGDANFFSFSNPSDWATVLFAGMNLTSSGNTLPGNVMPFSPQYFLDGLDMETLGCVLLGVDIHSYYNARKGVSKSPKGIRAHLLLVQLHGPTVAHRISKLKSNWDLSGKEHLFDIAKLKEKFKWRDVQLV
jgi:hypothetical protein